MTREPDKLEHVLNYSFSDKSLVETALTHRSFGTINNERLEFLGDAILGYVIANKLFESFPSAPEGNLSRMRSVLVNKETLASIARDLDLGEYIRLGSGETKSGGSERDSILADAVEALIAAIYLDSGLKSCNTVVELLFKKRIEENLTADQPKDAKTRLQEFEQAIGHGLPEYTVMKIEGEAHQQIFHVQCKVQGRADPQVSFAASKRLAEQGAAKKVLQILEDDH